MFRERQQQQRESVTSRIRGCNCCSVAAVTSFVLATQDMEDGSDEERQSASNSGSDHRSTGLGKGATKKRKDHASAARHSARDSSLGRGNSVVQETKAVEGRRRLRKAS